MVKSIIFFTVVLVLSLFLLTNLFFSYELRIRHEATVKRIQDRMRQGHGETSTKKTMNDGAIFPPKVSPDVANRHKVDDALVLPNLGSLNVVATNKNHHDQLIIDSSTTKTPEKGKSNQIQTRTIFVSDYSNDNSDTATLRQLQVVDTSLVLRNSQNWRNTREHFIRSAQKFFPSKTVKSWRSQLLESWNNQKSRVSSWVFATNNDGERFGRKVMSRENIEARKKLAKNEHKWNKNSFCYTKWEMQRKHPLHFEIRKFMTSSKTKQSMCKMLAEDCPKDFVEKSTLGDFFVSLYEHDDFLSPHSDLSLGSITIAAHFLIDTSQPLEKQISDDDDEGGKDSSGTTKTTGTDSGAVEFYCVDTNSYCVKMRVSKNELVVFKTQPDNANHQVTQMTDPKYLRFGITGFYAMPGEAAILEY